jgi:hypothetical protein
VAKLGEIFGSEIDNVTEAGGNCLMRSFCNLCRSQTRWSDKGQMG